MQRQKSRKRYGKSAERPYPVAEPPLPEIISKCKRRVAPKSTNTEPGATVPRAARTSRKPRRVTRAQRYRKAAALLREWMADDSGYDERIWPLLEEELKKDPIRFAEEFE